MWSWTALVAAIILIIAILLIPMSWIWKIVGVAVAIILGLMAFMMIRRFVDNQDMKMPSMMA